MNGRDSMYPRGTQKPPRLHPNGDVTVRGSSMSTWQPIEVVPRIDVKGKHFGSEHPKFRAVLEWNRISGQYRTRPLTDVIDI